MNGRKARQIRQEADRAFADALHDIDTRPLVRELARLRGIDQDPRRAHTRASRRRKELIQAEIDRRGIDPAVWLPEHDWSTPQTRE